MDPGCTEVTLNVSAAEDRLTLSLLSTGIGSVKDGIEHRPLRSRKLGAATRGALANGLGVAAELTA